MKLGESQDSDQVYQKYFKRTVLKKEADLECYLFFESEFAYRFHFDKQVEWGKRMIDFGGRIGEKTSRIRNVTVVEIDDYALRWMRTRGMGCSKSLERFKDNSIDTIYCSHTLEHLENPVDYLRLFCRKLKPGGALITVTPAEVQSFEPSAKIEDPNGHIQTWNFANLMTSLSRVGLEPVSWRYNIFFLVLLLRRLKNRKILLKIMDFEYCLLQHKLYRNLLLLFYYFWRPFGRFIPLIDSRSEIYIVSRKR